MLNILFLLSVSVIHLWKVELHLGLCSLFHRTHWEKTPRCWRNLFYRLWSPFLWSSLIITNHYICTHHQWNHRKNLNADHHHITIQYIYNQRNLFTAVTRSVQSRSKSRTTVEETRVFNLVSEYENDVENWWFQICKKYIPACIQTARCNRWTPALSGLHPSPIIR